MKNVILPALFLASFVSLAAAEVPAIQFQPTVYKAFEKAMAENKPMVVVIANPLEDQSGVTTQRLLSVVFSEEFACFRNDAVFAIAVINADGSSPDDQAATLCKQLGTQRAGITILHPTKTLLDEVRRVDYSADTSLLIGNVDSGLKECQTRMTIAASKAAEEVLATPAPAPEPAPETAN